MAEAWKTEDISIYITLHFLHFSSVKDKENICRESINSVAKVTE